MNKKFNNHYFSVVFGDGQKTSFEHHFVIAMPAGFTISDTPHSLMESLVKELYVKNNNSPYSKTNFCVYSSYPARFNIAKHHIKKIKNINLYFGLECYGIFRYSLKEGILIKTRP